ncbi:MAG: glycosyltransferase [Chloroflexota bacterium]
MSATTMRILFIASLHHPETLQRERATAQANNQPEPLFPTSYAFHFWEKALRKQGHVLDVFYRNVSGFGSQDISTLKFEQYTNRITVKRIMQAVSHRLPYRLNPDLRQRNANLIAQARRFQPTHLWLIGDNRVIHADTLATLKAELGCKVIFSSGTSPIVFSHPIEREATPLFELVLTNDFYHGIQWRELGAREMVCLPFVAIDPDFHYPREAQPDYACDVGFVGTLLPANLYSERVDALASLGDGDIDLGIWSVHDVPSVLQAYRRGSALGDTMLDVVSSAKISLNVHGNFMLYGGNMRLFETAGVGTFQIVDERPGISDWFTVGEHLVTFRDADDLRDKVTYYLAHPDERERIAEAGRQHALAHHTYDHRLAALLPHLEGLE